MKKIIWLIVVLAVVGFGIYWFAGQDAQVPEETTNLSTEKECMFSGIWDGDIAQVIEVIPGGVKAVTATWEGDSPSRNFIVLVNDKTIFCEDFDFGDIKAEWHFQFKTADIVPREVDGFPKEGIIVTASEIRVP